MISKTITYTDFNENERTETFYFHLSKPELLETYIKGGEEKLIDTLKDALKRRDAVTFFDLLKDVIRLGYGEKSEDGRFFTKFDAQGRRLGDLFITSEAYSVLLMDDLFNDITKATEFLMGMFPSDIRPTQNEIEAALKELDSDTEAEVEAGE